MLVNAFYDDRHFDVNTNKYHNLLDENVRLIKKKFKFIMHNAEYIIKSELKQ